MLTVATISAEKGKDYYIKGYYLEETSRWWGQGAAKLKLSGAVDDEKVFQRILNGYSPSGRKKLGSKGIAADKNRRAAVDCTFNAPKSVSLQALVGGDERLFDAHAKAVEKTLQLIEDRYSHTRVRNGHDRLVVNTGNLVVAQFDHIESRAVKADENQLKDTGPDPHLHTHCLIMNMTELRRGVWYSHLNEGIYRNQKHLGMVYQHHLAMEVQKLGYEVEAKGQGQFDIKGFSSEDLQEFSKRRQKILATARNPDSARDRHAAWDMTRQRKKEIVPYKLRQRWRQEAEALGIDFVTPNEVSHDQCIKKRVLNEQHITEAIAHCAERNVAFNQEELEKFILLEKLPVALDELVEAIKQHPELIRLAERTGNRYTTQSALLRELATIRLMQEQQGKVSQILSPSITEDVLAEISLTDGQLQAISTALTTTDGIMAWQGVAGAGKTYALNHLTAISQRAGYTIKGFAPSAEAAKVLENEVGIETHTVARLLHSGNESIPEPNQLWIIDEAGLLSAFAAYQLLNKASQQQARVLFVGDTRQLSAVEAGNPFKSLQQAGMTTAYMDQSLRQKAPHLQEAVDLIAKGEIHSGFELLDKEHCIEEVGRDEKVQRIVEDYLAVSPEERGQTLVLAGTNRERLEITQGIRDGLRREGRLSDDKTVTQLKRKDLTKVMMKYAHNFEIGDVIVPLKNYKKRQLSKGKRYVVMGKDDDNVILQDHQGNTTTVDLSFEKAAYTQGDLAISVGDTLKWTKNNRYLGRRNGQQFKVTGIEGETATIEYEDGQLEQINLKDAQHFDYALVSTTYSSQGKTADKVLISADYTVGKESFYVAVSRVKHDLKLYTDNKAELLEFALTSRAKENPLELLRARQKALFKGTKTDGEEISSLTTQPSSVSVIESNKNVTDLPQDLRVDAVSSVPSHRKPIRDNDEELIDNSNQINNEDLKELTNQSSEFFAQSDLIFHEKNDINNGTIWLEETESETVTDAEVTTPNNQGSQSVSDPTIISEEADTNLNESLKQLNDYLAKYNQISDQNQERLQELAERLKGDHNPKPTTEKRGVKKPAIKKNLLSYPIPKQKVKPSFHKPRPEKKLLLTPSKQQRLADLNNVKAISSLTTLMQFLNIPPRQGWRQFKQPPYLIKASTDYQTIELYSANRRGLILQKKDGRISGNLNEKDRELIALIEPEIDQRLNQVKQKPVKKYQQRSRDNGLTL
ncbi:MAG: MobF family relaxase [Crocosphaera sp.]|nr:MobF family relaxase [Crocosphaera sp.]